MKKGAVMMEKMRQQLMEWGKELETF
ncbi:fatty acid-binding protein DegV, partial [Enterococcus faecium]|nr:fatty acid-binding protein DegV [Enterococcus faecium]